MNISKTSSLSIDFNPKLNRISLASGNDGFVSLSQMSWKILITMMQFGSDFEHVKIDQNSSKVAIFLTNGDYTITFSGRTHTSVIHVKKEVVPKIIHQSEVMFSKITSLHLQENSKSTILKNKETTTKKKEESHFLVPPRKRTRPSYNDKSSEPKLSISCTESSSSDNINVPPPPGVEYPESQEFFPNTE